MAAAVVLASKYQKAKRIPLKKHPELKEHWVQARIDEDPSLLGLGTLKVFRKESQQPGGGRIDLILANSKGEEFGSDRYEVEVQLGATDPEHIVRTIEYWDKERSRNRGQAHYAVLIAEDITSRFLNVLSLLNKSVPLIAIQMQAMLVGESLTLVFTTVVDLRQEQDTEPQTTVARADWQKTEKAKGVLEKAEEIFSFVHGFDEGFELRFNQQYIGVNKAGRTFLALVPRKSGLRLRVTAVQSDELNDEAEQDGFPVEYQDRAYEFQLESGKYAEQAGAIKKFIKAALDANDW
jgi:hypothetical protein